VTTSAAPFRSTAETLDRFVERREHDVGRLADGVELARPEPVDEQPPNRGHVPRRGRLDPSDVVHLLSLRGNR
jgi:hypothetical protein